MQKDFDPRNALARRTNVAALPSIGPTGTDQTIVGAKDDCSAAENVDVVRSCPSLL
jgi:hypothetical protein